VTTRARQAEADRASLAFHVALTQIGVETIEEALALWQNVPPNARPGVAASWLRRAVSLVMFRRRQSRDLAFAYYRLVRALHTGSTIPDPRNPGPTVTLTELREQFASLAQPDKPQEERSSPPLTTDTEPVQETAEESSEDEEADRILIEELAGLEAEERRIEAAAEQELRTALAALGPINQQKLIDAIDDTAPASEVDALRDEANKRAGARQAAAAERIAMNGGRSTLWSLAERDKRAIGYVRLSRTGTPCGWCAMLISRGPVYRSEESATHKGAASYGDGDLYHDNCHCYALPIFSPEQYAGSALFALNREYAELWPRVTRGLSGKAAVSAWRRFIRTQQKAARDQASRASTTNVQEA
jgi:hypothetical protein